MGYRGDSPSFQAMVPLTPVVKRLLIANVGIWFFGQVILDQLILKNEKLILWFGMSPARVVMEFLIWQPITYMFLHALNPTHILFNMMLLWWLGGELEEKWKGRFFGTYYFVCGIGAAIFYIIISTAYWAYTGNLQAMISPVIGASGAVFGLMLAYGIIFGERVVSFMFLFQMKAKYFVLITGMVEVVIVINNGVGGSGVANLAHLGGIVSGYLFLLGWTRYQSGRRTGDTHGSRGGGGKSGRSKLKIVVSNDKDAKNKDSSDPKLWH